MQLSTISFGAPIATVTTPPLGPNKGPIGVGSAGTLKIGHALNGIAYTTHALTFPITAPFATYSGSLEDAIKGAQGLLLKNEAAGGPHSVVALLGMPGQYTAQLLHEDHDVARLVDTGVGHGGIASAEFTSVSRSVGALVTSTGALTLADLAPQGAPKA